MQQINVTRTVAGAPQQVWDVLADHAGWRDWSGLQHSSLEKEGPDQRNGTGAVRCLGSYGFNAFEEILDFEPPSYMTYRLLRGGLPMKNHLGEVRLEPDGRGTRVTWRCRFDSGIPGLGWLLRLYIDRFFRSVLDRLAERMQAAAKETT